jgi:dihydroorotase
MYDLLVKGGVAIDPSQNLHKKQDIVVYKGIIESVEGDISADQAKEVLDVSGYFVAPGFIDLHVHVYPGVSHYGIDCDPYTLAQGVTTVAEAGSAGADTFEGFRRHVVNPSRASIYAFLNISSTGMISPNVGELEDLRFADVEKAVRICEKNRDIIRGIKVRLSKNIVGKNQIEPLKLALKAAEEAEMPVMVHHGNTPTPLIDIVSELREGDILTHCFHGLEHGILDSDGAVLGCVKDAVKRGVILDVGHGKGSFSFDVAKKALSQEILPETISTDLHYYNVFGPVYSLAVTASKFLHLGLSLEQVLERITIKPAKILGVDRDHGNLRRGSAADITVFELEEGKFVLEDTVGKTVTGRKMIKPVAVIKDGQIYVSKAKLLGR